MKNLKPKNTNFKAARNYSNLSGNIGTHRNRNSHDLMAFEPLNNNNKGYFGHL